MKGKLLLFGILLAARMAFSAEDVGQFAKQSLGLDLASIPFGESAATTSGYAITDPPLPLTLGSNEQSFSWRTSAISKEYRQKFPNRTLIFGFKNDRLAAVRITADVVVNPNEKNRAELLQIYEDLFKGNSDLRATTRKFPFDDDRFHLKVAASCGLDRQSLFIMELHITPADVKKSE